MKRWGRRSCSPHGLPTPIEYFVETMAKAADQLRSRAQQLHAIVEPSEMPWERLSRRQQQVLTRLLLGSVETKSLCVDLGAPDIKRWFEVSANTARAWLHDWVTLRFIEPADVDGKGRVRRYRLHQDWLRLVARTLEATVADGW